MPYKKPSASRRKFLRNSLLTAAGIYIIPRHVMGRGFTAPSDRLNIAGIGAGGKGTSDIAEFFKSGRANIVALCDVDDAQAKKSREAFPKAKYYKDFRKLLEAEAKHIDAISVSTPDHTHAIIALAAMEMGKHVYVQKPLTHDIFEARQLTEAAKKYKVVTQMGNQGASGEDVRKMQEWYNAGLIGEAHTIRCWTNRPVWPQGFAMPMEKQKVPKGLDWNLWIGPSPYHHYNKGLAPFNWRGYWDYGTGAMGDMGCHIIDPAFRVCGLQYPSDVECSVGSVFTKMWTPDYHPESCPISSSVILEYPQKNGKSIKLTWMDGGITPERPDELLPDELMGDDGSGGIIEGSKGKIIFGTYGAEPRLLPTSRMEETKAIPATLARVPEGHYAQWVNACIAGYGNTELSSSFDYAGPLTEAILMGNLALRSWNIKNDKDEFIGRKRLLWDAENMRVTNFEPANQFVKREYRKGW